MHVNLKVKKLKCGVRSVKTATRKLQLTSSNSPASKQASKQASAVNATQMQQNRCTRLLNPEAHP